MSSKHGFIIVLLTGATALIVVLGLFLTNTLTTLAEPYLTGRVAEDRTDVTTEFTDPPRLFTKIEGTDAVIVEVDNHGDTVRTIYRSSLTDGMADFVLLAVPQEHYAGTIYVQTLPDADSPYLIVYPLDVTTGQLGPSVINTPADAFYLSPNNERVFVINVTSVTELSMIQLTDKAILAAWALGTEEWLSNQPPVGTYNGLGADWVSPGCVEHGIWHGNPRLTSPLVETETRMFCAP